jgi:PAS domain S-box-containing protein
MSVGRQGNCEQPFAAVTPYFYRVTFQGDASFTEHGSGCLATTGYGPENYASDPLLWIKMVHPEDRDALRRHVARVLAGEDVLPIEHRILHWNSTTRWVRHTIVQRHDTAGSQVGYDGLLEDITEHDDLVKSFQRTIEFVPDAVVITDADGRVVLVNAQTEGTFGYERGELLGRSVTALIPTRFHQKHSENIAAYVAAPHVRPMGAGLGIVGLRKDGTEFPAEVSLGPLEIQRGIHVVCMIRDVTERKQVMETLRDHEAQLLAAQRIQECLLPQSVPRLPGFDIAGVCHPAEFAGGDYFDYLPMADRKLGLVIADVSGHGFAPALLMSAVQSHLRALVDVHTEMGTIVHRVNTLLVERTEESQFVTLFFARIDPASRRLTYINAGHPSGYVLDESGNVKSELASTASLLGVLPDAEFIPKHYGVLEPGDLLLLLTDGILEAYSSDGIQFGVDRALGVVRDHRDGTAREIVDALYREVLAFSRRNVPSDDVTAVVVKGRV